MHHIVAETKRENKRVDRKFWQNKIQKRKNADFHNRHFYMVFVLVQFLAHPGQDILSDDLNQGVQLFFCGFPAQGYPEGAVNGLRGNMHGG